MLIPRQTPPFASLLIRYDDATERAYVSDTRRKINRLSIDA